MSKITRPTRPLADVHVLSRRDGSHEIVVSFMPDPDLLFGGEANSRAFLALDASASLKKMYGFGGPFGGDPNYMQAVARKLGATLSSVTRSGKVFATYWAVSPDGSKVEPIGELDEAQWQQAAITGPKKEKWGKGTKLLPALQLCCEKAAVGFDWTIGVFVTDGIIEDEEACKRYCLQIGKEIELGRRKPIKGTLLGIGEEVDRAQLDRFDNLFEGTGIDYELWSHGLIASMQEETDILAALYGSMMTEETIVAPRGWVEDGRGTTLRFWSDGLPGRFRFELPRGQTSFAIRTPNQFILQEISEALA
jgi:hypothetical protein